MGEEKFKNIKNIIFDLGGVILNVDYNFTADAFEKLGVRNAGQFYNQLYQNEIFDRFETGRISAGGFRREIRKYLPEPVSDSAIDQVWNAMLLDLPIERLNLLKSLKKKYRLFLLSNTNVIHLYAFEKIIYSTYGIRNLDGYFEKQYFSCKVGMRKPESGIFELVLSENGLVKQETLFVDDSPQHVAGAGEVGIQAILLEKENTLIQLCGHLYT